MKMNSLRVAKHGRSQQQYDHFRANESTRHAKKEKVFVHYGKILESTNCIRNSQLAIAWTEEHCQYVDSLMAIDFSHTATRNENNYSLGVNGQGPKP